VIDYTTIDRDILGGIRRYVKDRIRPGDFLCAVLRNDLKSAFVYADDTSIETMHSIVGWLWNEVPSVCWGSPEKFDAWLAGAHPGTEKYCVEGGD
jgi:hypothetical protein